MRCRLAMLFELSSIAVRSFDPYIASVLGVFETEATAHTQEDGPAVVALGECLASAGISSEE